MCTSQQHGGMGHRAGHARLPDPMGTRPPGGAPIRATKPELPLASASARNLSSHRLSWQPAYRRIRLPDQAARESSREPMVAQKDQRDIYLNENDRVSHKSRSPCVERTHHADYRVGTMYYLRSVQTREQLLSVPRFFFAA